jgi:EAL domain-containing protein (putative c-di-GMP-specific phosphodiesterase class I)
MGCEHGQGYLFARPSGIGTLTRSGRYPPFADDAAAARLPAPQARLATGASD